MNAHALRRAPRRLGPRLFVAVLVVFWILLAWSGRDSFKRPGPAEAVYTIRSEDLAGVTGLRMEGENGSPSHGPLVRVVLDGTSQVRISLRSRGNEDEDASPASGEAPRMSATREGDTLVLRWTGIGGGPLPMRGPKALHWMDEIVLPAQFQRLALARAVIEARTPMDQLVVAGQEITVGGHVRHLDLWSTQCRPCKVIDAQAPAGDEPRCVQPRHRGTDELQVKAAHMRSLRVNARAGQVSLLQTDPLERVDLQLGDSVALSLDRAGLLERVRRPADSQASQALQVPAVCLATTAGLAKALELVQIP